MSTKLIFTGTPFSDWSEYIDGPIDVSLSADLEAWYAKSFGKFESELEQARQAIASQGRNGFQKRFDADSTLFSMIQAEISQPLSFRSACWTLSECVPLLSDSIWVVFWKDPLRTVFQNTRDLEEVSLRELLDSWLGSAHQILAALRQYRGRILLLNLEECLAHNEACFEFFKKRFGINLSVRDRRNADSRNNPILPIFERISCQAIPKLQRILEELDVSSIPLNSVADGCFFGKPLNPSVLLEGLDAIHATRIHALKLDRESVAAAEQSSNQIEDLRRELAESQAQLEEKESLLKQSEEKALENYEMLLLELHTAHQESETFFEEWKKSEDESQARLEEWKKSEASAGESLLKVESISRGNIHDEGEYRHIDYNFQGIRLFDRSWPSLHIRLVLHGDHPGLVLFEGAESVAPPLQSWQPNGQENGMPFVILVPANTTGRDFLVRATTSDLAFVRDVILKILGDLSIHDLPTEITTDWVRVCNVLLEQISDIPERLHYDAVFCDKRAASDGGSPFFFRICHPSFRGQSFPELSISWLPSAAGGRLVLQAPQEGAPLLFSWTHKHEKQDGGYLHEKVFDLGETNQFEQICREWIPLTHWDRAFVKFLFLEIDNFLVHYSEQHPSERTEVVGLVRQAEIDRQLREIAQQTAGLKKAEGKPLALDEMLLLELQDAHQESEKFRNEWKRAESESQAHLQDYKKIKALAGKSLLEVASISKGDIHDEGEHRHIDYTFQEVKFLDRHWKFLRLRLVLHRGNPGLVLFEAQKPEEPPLRSWQPQGQENGVSMMLFVPRDAAASDALVRATTSDLLFVKEAVSLILADLSILELPQRLKTDWIWVAKFLLDQIGDIRERIHYDSVECKKNTSSEEGGLYEFRIFHPYFRGRYFPELLISWLPSPSGGKLVLYSQKNSIPPLSSWSPSPDRAYPQEKVFILENKAHLAAEWKQMTHWDRAFIENLAWEIQNFLFHYSQQHPDSAIFLSQLRKQARRLHRELKKASLLADNRSFLSQIMQEISNWW